MRAAGYSFVAAGAVLLASNGIVSSLVFQGDVIDAKELAAIRVYGAAALLGLGVIALLPGLSRSALLRLAAFGVFGINMPQWLYYEAISRIAVPVVLVIVYSAPVVVTAFERVVRNERLPRAVYACIVIAIGGVVAMVLGGEGGIGALSAAGLILAVLTVVAYSGQILLASIQPTELSPVRRLGGAMLFAAGMWLVVAPLWQMPWSSMDAPTSLGPRIDDTVAVGVLVAYVTVVGTIVAFSLLIAGTPRIGPSAAAVTAMVEPIVASVLAWIVLGQSLTPVQVVALVVALGGATAAEVLRTRARTAAERTAEAEEVFVC